MLIPPFLGMGLLIPDHAGLHHGIGPYIQYRLRRYYTAGARTGTSRIRPAYWRRTILAGFTSSRSGT